MYMKIYGEKPLMYWTLADVKQAVQRALYPKNNMYIVFEDYYTKNACAFLKSKTSNLGTAEFVIAEVNLCMFCYMPYNGDMEYTDFDGLCNKIYDYISENYHWRAEK